MILTKQVKPTNPERGKGMIRQTVMPFKLERTEERVNDGIVRKVLKRDDRRGYTLIIDPTIIESCKHEA